MMKYITISLFLFIFSSSIANCQSLRDHTWVLGYSTQIQGQPNLGYFGGVHLNFLNGKVSIDTFDIFTSSVSGCANDETGKLQFYTSGCKIFNYKNEIMEGGDDLILGGVNPERFCNEVYGSIFNLLSSTVILPIPSHPDQYLDFQLRLEEMPNGTAILDKFFYSTIDMSANNGLGKVVTKHQIAIEDSLHDAVAAVRHGNGRDWWVLIPRGTERQFWELLISPEGITNKILRTLPPQEKFNVTVIEGDPPFQEVLLNEYSFEQ